MTSLPDRDLSCPIFCLSTSTLRSFFKVRPYLHLSRRVNNPPCLAQYIVDHMRRLDAGELLIQTLVLENKFFVVYAQLTENGGVKVADVDGVLDDVVGHLVGLAIDKAGLHAAAGHPDAETAGMMVAAIIFLGERAMTKKKTAKF